MDLSAVVVPYLLVSLAVIGLITGWYWLGTKVTSEWELLYGFITIFGGLSTMLILGRLVTPAGQGFCLSAATSVFVGWAQMLILLGGLGGIVACITIAEGCSLHNDHLKFEREAKAQAELVPKEPEAKSQPVAETSAQMVKAEERP